MSHSNVFINAGLRQTMAADAVGPPRGSTGNLEHQAHTGPARPSEHTRYNSLRQCTLQQQAGDAENKLGRAWERALLDLSREQFLRSLEAQERHHLLQQRGKFGADTITLSKDTSY